MQEWLDELLPPDAAERCHDQVSIVVTQLPFCNQVAISDFKDKADLINVAMASAHVPLFLDWKASRPCRGVQCVDGSFPDFFSGVNCDLLTLGGNAVVFDYFDVSAPHTEQACSRLSKPGVMKTRDACILFRRSITCNAGQCRAIICFDDCTFAGLTLTGNNVYSIWLAWHGWHGAVVLMASGCLLSFVLQDANIIRNGRMDMLELKEFKQFKKIILLGYRFAQRKHEEGEFARFDMSDVLKQRF